tara:strand:- start:328 stop:1029 length:702 start_codon:yes stop_codon:yes gene_type:complete
MKNIKKERKKKSKIYFGKPAQDAVEEFLLVESTAAKHKIFNEKLHAPFSKLIENIVFTYHFINMGEPVQSVQLECLSHIYLNIHKYKPEKGKAFSYFGTMTKNYLIQKATKATKSKNIDFIDEMSENRVEQLSINNPQEEKDRLDFNEYLILLVAKHLDKNLKNIKNQNEKKVVQALLQLIEYKDELDLYNKKQLYVLLKELTNLPTKKITQVLNKVRTQYQIIKRKHLEGRT